MNLETFIAEYGYSVPEKHYINFKNMNIDFLHFKRLETIEYQEMSDYFLVEVTRENSTILFENSKLENFKAFQKKLISDVFFEYKNDIRWNIYLIFLIKENEANLYIPVREIEKDTNYARKYIFNIQELKDFLNGTIFLNIENADTENQQDKNPESVWINKLHKHNLSACLTQNFQENNIDLYLETQNFNDTNLSTTIDNRNSLETNIPTIKKVNKLNLGELSRPCFRNDKILEPVQVNLLHGANGTGKTTFLETIELAITGKNTRSKLFKEDLENEVSITCSTSEGIQIFSSKKTPMESKKLENKWYGVPIGRSKSTLNQNFSLFNYFDTDKPYRFALEEIDEEDDSNQYLNRFSQLIFGDHIIKMQKNWLRYKVGFEDRSKKLCNSYKGISDQIIEISNKITELKESSLINNNYLIDSYKKFIITQNFVQQNNLSEEYIKYAIDVIEYLKIPLEKLSMEAQENVYKKLIPRELTKQFEDTQFKLFEINKEIHLISSQKENFKIKETNLKKKNQQQHNHITNSLNSLKELEDSRNEWLKHKNILQQQERISQRQTLLLDIQKIDDNLKLIDYINKNWPEINEIKDISFITNTINLDDLKNDIYTAKSEIIEADKKISDYKRYVGELEELQIKIKNLGIEYLKKNTTGNCPLCDSTYGNHQELINNINNKSYTHEEATLSEISKAKIISTQKLIEFEAEYQNEIKKIKIKKAILDCANNVLNLNDNKNIKQLYFKIKDFLNQETDLKNHKNHLSKLLEFIEDDGINEKTINNGKLFIARDLLYNKFVEEKNVSNFEIYLNELEELHNKIILSNKNQSEEISKVLQECEAELLEIEANLSKLNFNKNELLNKVKLIEDTLHSIDELKNYFYIDQTIDLYVWQDELKIFKDNLIKAMDYYNKSKEFAKERENLAALELKQVSLKKQLTICNSAIEILSNLPKHEEFVESFIKENLGKIEYLFKAIHAPKEFTTLEFDKTGIIATREINGIKAKAHQMSTGQRVSLALSVMFTHFLAAPNAPDFLLLDEPVANMDDLHLLNLLDIIREIALKGTQILFTTANPDVAGLFRRKFSFFGNEFKKFEFVRDEDGTTLIKELTYSPELEDEITIKSI